MNAGFEKLKMRLPAIVLLAATLLFWGLYDRYEAAGPILLDSPALARANRVRGDCTETNGLITLRVPEAGKTAGINFRMPAAKEYERIRVRARIRVEDVVPGKFSWSCARLLMTQYDQNEKWIPGHHGVVSERGSKDWELHEDVFEINPAAAHADVVIQQTGLSGTAQFDQLSAEPVRFRSSYVWWRIIFSTLWILAGILYFRRCRLNSRRLRVLITLNALAILFGTMMPGTWVEDSTEWVKAAAKQAIEKRAESAPSKSAKEAKPAPGAIRKTDQETSRIDQFNLVVGNAHRAGHFALFASLCFLVYCSAALERQHGFYYFKVAFDILLFAAVTESLQHLTSDRTAGISDWLTDVYGMLLALVLFVLFRKIGRSVFRLNP